MGALAPNYKQKQCDNIVSPDIPCFMSSAEEKGILKIKLSENYVDVIFYLGEYEFEGAHIGRPYIQYLTLRPD